MNKVNKKSSSASRNSTAKGTKKPTFQAYNSALKTSATSSCMLFHSSHTVFSWNKTYHKVFQFMNKFSTTLLRELIDLVDQELSMRGLSRGMNEVLRKFNLIRLLSRP
jgi:hypothetical protein